MNRRVQGWDWRQRTGQGGELEGLGKGLGQVVGVRRRGKAAKEMRRACCHFIFVVAIVSVDVAHTVVCFVLIVLFVVVVLIVA